MAKSIEPGHSKPSNPKDLVGIAKIPASCVSQLVMAEIGVGMLEGALKYGRHNYRGVGVRASVYYDATRRHLDAYWEGEDIDAISELSHVTKAITSLIVLRDAMIMGLCEDDRPPKLANVADFYADLNKKCEALLKKHSAVNPKHWVEKAP